MKNHLMKEDLLSTPKLNAESLFYFIFYVTLAQILLITGSGYVKITSKITNDGVHKKEIKRGQTFSIIMKKKSFVFFMSDKEIKSHFVLHARYLTDLLVSLNVILNYWDWLIGPSY